MKIVKTLVFAALLGGFFVSAHAQGVGQLGSGQVWGNAGPAQNMASPTTVGGTGGLFDRICSSTIGQAWVRASNGWGCTSLGYANPVWWGADPTGVSTSDVAINSALTASKYVKFPSGGTFKIGAAVKLNTNNRLDCQGATITQGNAANLTVFIDAFTNVPNGAQVDHCVIDGNVANNTTGVTLIDVSGVNNVTLVWNVIQNFNGVGINFSNATYGIIEHNFINSGNSPNNGSSGTNGIAVFNTSVGSSGFHQIRFNTVIGAMTHMLWVQLVDTNDISYNWLLGTLAIGGNNSAMQVTVSGTSVTWVSGTNFAGVIPGMFLVVNAGNECQIASVNSTTSLTLTASCGTLTNVPAAIGGGDNLAIYGTSFNRIIGNHVFGAVTGGIVVSTVGGATPRSAVSNNINDNYVYDSGNFGIALEAAAATGNPVVNNTNIIGNYINNPGRAGAAGVTPAGIQLSSPASQMSGVQIEGNYLLDSFTVAGGFWLTASGVANATNVTIGVNTAIGFANGTAASGYPTYIGAPWTSYTPTMICGTGAVSGYTRQSGAYSLIGKTVIVNIDVQASGVGTCAAGLSVSLPVTTSSLRQHLGGSDYTSGVSLHCLVPNGATQCAVDTASAGIPTVTDDLVFTGTLQTQ